MCGWRGADLAHRHLAECAHETVPPFGRQRLPDRIGRPLAHRVIQASAPPHIALGDRVSEIRRILSNYQRCLVWCIKSLFKNLKHGFGLKDAWQQSRQVLMRWVTLLAAGYAINQMLAYTDPARLAGLAEPAPWRAPGSRTAGLVQAGIARILREVGRPAFIAAIWGKISATASGTRGSSAPPTAKAA